jgi:hypothetical protein
MQSQIVRTAENEWTLAVRGQTMRLVHARRAWAEWEMYTNNAAARAWNHGRESYHGFDSLAAVEAHYRSWRGFAALYDSSQI